MRRWIWWLIVVVMHLNVSAQMTSHRYWVVAASLDNQNTDVFRHDYNHHFQSYWCTHLPNITMALAFGKQGAKYRLAVDQLKITGKTAFLFWTGEHVGRRTQFGQPLNAAATDSIWDARAIEDEDDDPSTYQHDQLVLSYAHQNWMMRVLLGQAVYLNTLWPGEGTWRAYQMGGVGFTYQRHATQVFYQHLSYRPTATSGNKVVDALQWRRYQHGIQWSVGYHHIHASRYEVDLDNITQTWWGLRRAWQWHHLQMVLAYQEANLGPAKDNRAWQFSCGKDFAHGVNIQIGVAHLSQPMLDSNVTVLQYKKIFPL